MIENRGSRIAIFPPPTSTFPRVLLLLGLFFAVLSPALSFALDVPPLRARVNDLAGMLSPETARALEQRLADFERETGHQIAVLTIPSLEGDALEDFSIRVAEAWKIGKKGFDNGVILLIAQKERKLRIEVGYGLEGVLPDAIASRIIREVIVPRFRDNDYSGGIVAGVNAVLQVTKGEPIPETARNPNREKAFADGSMAPIGLIAAMLGLFIGMTQRSAVRGVFGGSAAGLITAAGGGAGIGFAMLLVIVIGAFFGGVATSLGPGAATNRWSGGSRHRRSGWGGGIFSGGGGFGGGGFSGGGGGFGGGGASGSW